MEIIVKRGEEQFGPFSLDQLKGHLESGTVMPEDWAWHDGLDDWVPAQSLVELSSGGSMPELISSSSAKSTSSSTLPKAGGRKKAILAGAAILILVGGLAAAFLLGVFGGEEEPVAGEPDAGKSSKQASSNSGVGESRNDGGSGVGTGGPDNTPPQSIRRLRLIPQPLLMR